jgi:predicted chitinase
LSNPDLVLSDVLYEIESTFVFSTVTKNVNPVADAGSIHAVTVTVNGGDNAYAARQAAYNSNALFLGIPLVAR